VEGESWGSPAGNGQCTRIDERICTKHIPTSRELGMKQPKINPVQNQQVKPRDENRLVKKGGVEKLPFLQKGLILHDP
jgi:hypothetical protein